MELTQWFSNVTRVSLASLLVLAISLSLAACGDTTTTTTQPTATSGQMAEPTATTATAGDDTGGAAIQTPATASDDDGGDAQEVELTLTEWAIEPKTVEVNAGRVRFIVKNEGQFTHNVVFRIEGQGEVARTPNFKSDASPQTLEVDLKPGTYRMICDITGHSERGMEGTLVVK